LLVGHVDADHPAVATGGQRCQEAVHAGAAAEIEDRLARGDLRQVEEMADARERVDRGRGDPVEVLGRIAEPLCERAAGLEVELALRLERDLLVHLLDALLELVCVERPCGRAHRTPPSVGTRTFVASDRLASRHSGQPPSSRRADLPAARSSRTASWA
jgi:hypothetical protein